MFKLSIETGNAAFEDFPHEEIARILRGVADKLEQGANDGNLRDVNGNHVGTFEYKP